MRRRSTRRLAVTMAVAASVSVVPVVPAAAQDLDEWFETAAQAEFSGRQLTECETPDGRLVEVVDVAQRDGVLSASTKSGEGTVKSGAVYEKTSDGARISTVESAAAWSLAERYDVRVAGTATVVGREADLVEVVEGDLVRVRYAFDRATGAVLSSEVNGGDGSVYCASEFLTFQPSADITDDEAADWQEVLVTVAASADQLPEALAGFARRDLYEGPHDSVAGFYSDGLFSFTVFAADRRISVAGLDDASTVEIDGHNYLQQFGPGQIVYSWESSEGGFVVIGDMPPDLGERVLADLPEPGRRGFFSRMWRRIFGKPAS